MTSAAQQKPLNLPDGLFLIRYEGAEDTRHPPKVTLSVAPMSEAAVEFVLPPGIDDPVLWSPGASVVVRIARSSQLLVEVSASHPGGSVSARIQSVALSTDPTGLAAASASGNVDASDLRLLGHVAGRGDVFVSAGEW